jgi:hypothetical protein
VEKYFPPVDSLHCQFLLQNAPDKLRIGVNPIFIEKHESLSWKVFYFSFSLMKKKQKIKTLCQPEFFALCLNSMPT